MASRKELIKNYESWEALLEDNYTTTAEIISVKHQWLDLADNKIARYIFARNEDLCKSQIIYLVNDEIQGRAPYKISSARYGYSFTLPVREFITNFRYTIEVLLHKLGDHELLPKTYIHSKDIPWDYRKLMDLNNLVEYDFVEKVQKMLGLEDIEVYLPNIYFF